VFEREKAGGHPPSPVESLGIYFGSLVVTFAALLLFIFLGDWPFGIQIATAITYTAAVFLFVFFTSRVG